MTEKTNVLKLKAGQKSGLTESMSLVPKHLPETFFIEGDTKSKVIVEFVMD